MSYSLWLNRLIKNNLGYSIYETLYRSRLLPLNIKSKKNIMIFGNGHFPKRIAMARNKNGETEYCKAIKKDIDEQFSTFEKRLQHADELVYFYPYEEYEYTKNIFLYEHLKKINKDIKMIINNNKLLEKNFYHFDLYRYDYFSKKERKKINLDFDKKFLFLNNKQHLVRDRLYLFLTDNLEILNNSYYSFIYKNIDLPDRAVNKNFEDICAGERCFYKTHTSFLKDDYLSNQNSYFFEKAFLYLVTETNPYLNFNFLTEKTYKAFYHGIPFMLLSSKHSLQHLKKLGFKTFDRWLDESYDNEEHIKKRIEMVFNEIKRINTISISELKKIKKEMLPILEYNRERYLTQMNNDFISFFNGLFND